MATAPKGTWIPTSAIVGESVVYELDTGGIATVICGLNSPVDYLYQGEQQQIYRIPVEFNSPGVYTWICANVMGHQAASITIKPNPNQSPIFRQFRNYPTL